MSKLHGLDAYGYVVNAWLDGELETSGLSEIPALGWFWSDLLKHRMWMVDELENWAGIIRENDQPFRDGEGFREEGPGDHVDQHQEDDDARPVDDFDPEANGDQQRPDREDFRPDEPVDDFDPDANDDQQRPDQEDIRPDEPVDGFDPQREDDIRNVALQHEDHGEVETDQIEAGPENNNFNDNESTESQGDPDIAKNYSSAFTAIANKLSGTTDYDDTNFREFFHGNNGEEAHSEASKAILAELSFMGDLSEHFDELGNFTGTVKLVDNDGTIIEDNIPSFTDPFGLMYPDTGMMPGMREDYIFVFVSEEIQEGYSFEVDFKIGGELDGSADVTVGPLMAESYPISEFWSLDAFQLDVKTGDTKYSINGMEESEGYFDITNDQIVLKGTNLGLNDGTELGFAEHEGLPNKIKSFATYTVSNLTETGRETIFNLTNKKGKVVDFNDDKLSERLENLSENMYGSNDGLRMAISKVETQFRIDWDMAGNVDFISLDPLITEDLILETWNPDALEGEDFSSWTKLELSDVQAAFSEIQISLKQEDANPSLQATDYAIPEDWEIRMSYDDLVKESIPADALANEIYLFFDKSIFDVIIDNEDLTNATLTIGPSGASQITVEDIHELESLDALIQAITNSAGWAEETDITWTQYIESHFIPGYGYDGMGYEEPHDMADGQPPIHTEDGGAAHDEGPDINQEHQNTESIRLVMQEEEGTNNIDNAVGQNANETDNTGGAPVNGGLPIDGGVQNPGGNITSTGGVPVDGGVPGDGGVPTNGQEDQPWIDRNQPNNEQVDDDRPVEEANNPGGMHDESGYMPHDGNGDGGFIGGETEGTEVVNPGLKLVSETEGEGLNDFSVTLTLQHQDGELNRVYNSIWFGKLNEEGTAVASDPDSYSLTTRSWQNWDELNTVKIDRYGDGLGLLGIDDSVDYPEWSDYFPNIFFETPWHLPWNQQKLAAKTLKVEGKAFDNGDDLLLNVELEIPKEHEGGHTHSEHRHYTLLVDIYGGGSDQETPLSELEQEELFMMSGGGFKDPYGPKYDSEIHIPLELEDGETAFTPELLIGQLQQKLESFFDGLKLYESFDFGSNANPSHNSITDGQQFRALIDLYAEAKGLEAVVTEVAPFDDGIEEDDLDLDAQLDDDVDDFEDNGEDANGNDDGPTDEGYGLGLEITVGDELFTWNVSVHGGDPESGTGPHATRDGRGLSFTDQELAAIKDLDDIDEAVSNPSHNSITDAEQFVYLIDLYAESQGLDAEVEEVEPFDDGSGEDDIDEGGLDAVALEHEGHEAEINDERHANGQVRPDAEFDERDDNGQVRPEAEFDDRGDDGQVRPDAEFDERDDDGQVRPDAEFDERDDDGQGRPDDEFDEREADPQDRPDAEFDERDADPQDRPNAEFDERDADPEDRPDDEFDERDNDPQGRPDAEFDESDGDPQDRPDDEFDEHDSDPQGRPDDEFDKRHGDASEKSYGPGLEITVGNEIFTWNVSVHGGDPEEGTGPHATRDGQGLSFTEQELNAIKNLDKIDLFADQVLSFGDIVNESDEFRTLSSTTIDFNTPEGGEKPSVDMWGYVVFDESNDIAFMEAEQAYNSSFHTETHEWVNNFGLRKPGFEWAWTDPLGPDSDSNRRIQVDYAGMNELADIEDDGSTYKPGDIKLKIDKKLIQDDQYDVRVEWGHQLIITLKEESGIVLTPESKVSFELSDDVYDEEGALTKAGHGFVDVNGQKLEASKKIRVDNWAAFSQMGFDFSEQIMLNPEMSVVEGKKITLEFYGDANFSSDAEKATVPEKADFQFYSYDPARGVETSLTLSEEDITVDGKKLIFTLSESVPSGTFVEATYDPSLSFINDSSTESDNAFTNLNGVAAESFYFMPLRNESPDEQGPHIMFADVAGKMMHLQLEDPSGIYVGDAELSNENLPNPSNFSLEATDSESKTRKIAATSVILNRWGDLEFQLDSAVKSSEVVKLTYSGNSLKDSLKNSSKIRDFEVWNNSVDFSFEDANSWFLLNDLTNVVFNEGLYVQDNGNVSSLSSNFQFIDEYVFKLKEFSKVTIDLTDVNGETLDDEGDANLNFVLENERSFDYVGGSFNSKQDDWKDSPTNDERNISFQLPAGEWRLIVEHGETWNEISQDYQLKISTSAATFDSEKTFTEDSLTHDFEVNLNNYRVEKIFNVDVSGNLSFSLTKPKDFEGDVFMDLFDLGGQWLNQSWSDTFSSYVEAGSYRLEINSWMPPTPGQEISVPKVNISANLDTSVSLDIDTDTEDAPSGSITVDGVPTAGELNSLDPGDWWTMKLTGGSIYTLRATDFTEDVNLFARNKATNYEDWSVNWGIETIQEDGSFVFNPSDETLLFDLSTDQFQNGKTYQFIVNPHIDSFNSTSYSLIAKSHSNLEEAEKEIGTGIISYDDVFDNFFGEKSDLGDFINIDKNDLMGLAKLTEPTTDEVNKLKAELEKELGAKGQEISGNPIAFKSSLKSSDGSTSSSTMAVVVTKDVPDTVSDEVSSENINELKNNEPAELTSTGSTEEFGAKEVSELANDTKDEAEDLTPISQPVDVSARQTSGRLSGFLAESIPGNALQGENFNSNHASTTPDLGLQRIGIQLSDDIIAKLSDPSETRELIWYRKPSNSDAFIFKYDSTTGTGALLEDSDSDGKKDVMALYVRDGGRGDDDKQVNGEIVSPGGLAFASLTAAAPDTTTTTVINEDGVAVEVETVLWKLDVDSDGIINALADGLAITRRHLEGRLETDPVLNQLVSASGERTTETSVRKYLDLGIQTPDKVLDIDKSGTFDTSDLQLILRQATGTFPSASLSDGFSNDSVTHEEIVASLSSLIPAQQVT